MSKAPPAQPPAIVLRAARERLGLKQRELAQRLTAQGARCSHWTVERWETRSATRRRRVPAHLWPKVSAILKVDDPLYRARRPGRPSRAAVEASKAAETVPRSPVHRPAAPAMSVPPLLRPASPPHCITGCCDRFDCARCGAFAGVDAEAYRHVCPALGFLLAPSAELVAALAREDVA